MHSANSTTFGHHKIVALSLFLIISSVGFAQDNSPLSRYGLGDAVGNYNVVSRALGNIVAGYSDNKSVNLANPASLANLASTVFDFGVDVNIRTLKSNTSADKYTSKNLNIGYLQLGFPLYNGKLKKSDKTRNLFWAGSFGLKPVTRINYKIREDKRLIGVDSISNVYQGNGGISQANLSTGLRIKNFSLGITTGYNFGNKDFSTQVNILSDSVPYYRSSTENQSNFGGLFLNVGAQYYIATKNKGLLILGAYGNMEQKMNGNRTLISRTIVDDVNGNTVSIDTIAFQPQAKGNVIMPSSYSAGFTFVTDSTRTYLFGLDYSYTNWDQYRYFGQTDAAVSNSWVINSGFQYSPAGKAKPTSKYWSFVDYRLGVKYGKGYVNVNAQKSNDLGFSLGAGLPLTSANGARSGDYITMNTAIEYNARGSKNVGSIRENVIKLSLGITLNSSWFRRYKYQ